MKLDSTLIEGFVTGFLIKRFDKPTAIPSAHKEWWDLCCKDERFVAIAAPRGHAKSTAITHSFVLASALFRVKDFIIIVSDTETQAVQFLNDIKIELGDNSDLQALFGIDKFLKFTESDIIVQFTDGKKFRILAKGSEQSLRGLKWNGKRPNLIVCDDMENDELVMNKDRREKFMRWIYGALIPCLAPDGQMRVVGTILHLDSFLEQVMPKHWNKTTVREELKEYTDPDELGKHKNMWVSVKYRAHNEDFSCILWPERFTQDTLVSIRKNYTERGIPDVYSQEYLNYPLDPTKAYFKQSDFVPLSRPQKEDIIDGKLSLTYYIAIDPAISKEERRDYTAIIVCGMDSNRKLYLLHAHKERLDSREQIDMMFDLFEKYRPEFIAIEKEKITKALGPFIKEEMHKRNRFPLIVEIQPTKDLETRARAWQGRMRIGSVLFDKGEDWYAIYEDELRTFPRGQHDDYVAASAVMGLALDRMIEAPTKAEEEEEMWDEEFKFTMDGFNEGRSEATGY